jgi:hypothetical protein
MMQSVHAIPTQIAPLIIILFIVMGCVSYEDPVIPTHIAEIPTEIPIPSNTSAVVNTLPTPIVIASVAPTPLPLECPTVPVYPGAIRTDYRHSDESRIAVYETGDTPDTLFRWFFDNRRAPEWTWAGETPNSVVYDNRGPDEQYPAISLIIKIDETTLQKTIFEVRLIISHPHIRGNWCPNLEP